MKTSALILLMLAAASLAEPVTFQDGSKKEATGVKIIPAKIEFTTSAGTLALPLNAFKEEWVRQRFPDKERDALRERLDVLQSELGMILAEVKRRIKEGGDEDAATRREIKEMQAEVRSISGGEKGGKSAGREQDSAGSGGIPPSVLAKIKSQAESDYPGNFIVQKVMIDEQIESYRTLHPSDTPRAVTTP